MFITGTLDGDNNTYNYERWAFNVLRLVLEAITLGLLTYKNVNDGS